MKYFDNYEVTAYTLDLGSGELKLTLDDGDKLTYDVPNVSVFRDDTKDYRTSYNQKHPDAPLQVDYYKIRDTSWLLTLIPTLVLLAILCNFSKKLPFQSPKQAFFDENYFYQSGFPLFFRISTYNSPIGLTFIPLCRI